MDVGRLAFNSAGEEGHHELLTSDQPHTCMQTLSKILRSLSLNTSLYHLRMWMYSLQIRKGDPSTWKLKARDTTWLAFA